MLAKLAVLSSLVLFGLGCGSAEAKFYFGNDERIHRIQDVTLTGPNREPLFLGYKISTFSLLLGVYLSDDGYVLALRSDRDRYFPMPQGAQLAEFQRRGFLPDPLPAYSLSWIDYALGYGLWIALPIVLLFMLVSWMRQRRKQASLERNPYSLR